MHNDTRRPGPRLSTWRLVPVNQDHPLWKASSVFKQIHVRARTATQARLIAAKEYAATPEVKLPGALTSPWLDRALVTCVRERGDTLKDLDVLAVIDMDTGQIRRYSP